MLTRTLAVICLISGLAAVSSAQKKASSPTCPVCHMSLSTKKTKSNTVAVKIKGKTYYCCSACKMKK